MGNNRLILNFIKDLNLYLKIKSIIVLIFSGKENFLNNVWTWKLNEKIIKKYWKSKSDLFSNDNYNNILSSKYLKNYLNLTIISSNINDFKSVITIFKNKYLSDNDILYFLENKNISSFWEILIEYRPNIPLKEFMDKKERINYDSWKYILKYKILTRQEIIDFITKENHSLPDKEDVLKYQPRVLSSLKEINEYAINLREEDSDVTYRLLRSVVNNFYFKLSDGKLIYLYPETFWKYGWFIGYTSLNKSEIDSVKKIHLMTYSESKYHNKVLKVRVFWKDLITTTSARKVDVIREISFDKNFNRFKRSYE